MTEATSERRITDTASASGRHHTDAGVLALERGRGRTQTKPHRRPSTMFLTSCSCTQTDVLSQIHGHSNTSTQRQAHTDRRTNRQIDYSHLSGAMVMCDHSRNTQTDTRRCSELHCCL